MTKDTLHIPVASLLLHPILEQEVCKQFLWTKMTRRSAANKITLIDE